MSISPQYNGASKPNYILICFQAGFCKGKEVAGGRVEASSTIENGGRRLQLIGHGEGAEEDVENNNNDDVPVEPLELDDKEEQELKERTFKTSKYMTKYECARILGTRALQIRLLSDWAA
ncbi:hypothetical protein SLEP1_g3517 [Rubroshorea leprosula]|uniref:Uncharacterized protein n=1 Tax=Rubroshorea leprosula TaxID=152421 RepID=A0AAV5HL72_9ROSI|nr:hypothetical protein SLEP1_g3517 [Rubroshorea leprosula]